MVTRTLGLRLARAQAGAVRAAGGVPVPFADLLAPEFLKAPDLMISDDMFHPSADGYALAGNQLLPALCTALGVSAADDRHGPGVARPRGQFAARADRRRLTAVAPAHHRGARADRRARQLGSSVTSKLRSRHA